MPTIAFSLQDAVIAALIGFIGAIAGQAVGAFLGARYSAKLARKTQIQLANLAFEREWREAVVRPFFELARRHLALIADFTEAVTTRDWNRVQDTARNTKRAESAPQVTTMRTLGDEKLTKAADAWLDAERRVLDEFDRVLAEHSQAEKKYFPSPRNPKPGPEPTVNAAPFIEFAEATARVQAEAARYVGGTGESLG